MAVGPFSFLNAPITRSPFESFGEVFKNYNQGKQDQLRMALEQAMAPGQLQQQQANLDLTRAQTAGVNAPKPTNYTGSIGDAIQLEQLQKERGEDDPLVKRLIETNRVKQKNEQVPAAVQSQLVSLKNMQQTLKNINQGDLTAYSGWGGGIQKLGNAIAPESFETDQYKRTRKEEAKSIIGAEQARNAFGAGTSEATIRHFMDLVNPSSWKNSPEIAKAMTQEAYRMLEDEGNNVLQSIPQEFVKDFEGAQKDNWSHLSSDQLAQIAGQR